MITVTRGEGMAPLLNQLHRQNQHDANFAVQISVAIINHQSRSNENSHENQALKVKPNGVGLLPCLSKA
jgi:hypothetical protein